MQCQFCGNIIKDGANFCNSCGGKIGQETQPSPVITDENFGEPESEQINLIEGLVEQSIMAEKPMRKRPGFFVSFFGFFITIVLTFLLVILCVVSVFLKFTNKESIMNIVEDAGISSEFLWTDEFDVKNGNTIGEAISKEISADISSDEAKEVIAILEADKFFEDLFSDFFSSVMSEEGVPEIDAGIIVKNLSENKDEIEEITGKKIDDKKIESFEKELDKMCDEINKEFAELNENFRDENPFTMFIDMARFLMYMLIGMIVIFCLLLVFMYRKSGIYRAFRCMAISSGLASLEMFLFVKIFDLYLNEIITDGSLAEEFAMKLLNGCVSLAQSVVTVFIVITALLVMVSVALKIYYVRNTRTE